MLAPNQKICLTILFDIKSLRMSSVPKLHFPETRTVELKTRFRTNDQCSPSLLQVVKFFRTKFREMSNFRGNPRKQSSVRDSEIDPERSVETRNQRVNSGFSAYFSA